MGSQLYPLGRGYVEPAVSVQFPPIQTHATNYFIRYCLLIALGIRPACVLCPNMGGAMKATRSGQVRANKFFTLLNIIYIIPMLNKCFFQLHRNGPM